MQTTATPESSTGKPSLLARYTIEEGERILVGQRVDGIVQITDRPLGHPGRPYLVETGISSMGELAALVADYKARAEALGDCPMRVPLLNVAESSRPREAKS
jgi:hypothetical protein